MKKILLFVAITFLSMKSWAVNAPVDARGEALDTLDFVGALSASIDNSTGTSLVVLNSTGTGAVSNGPAIVYGVIASSISSGDFLVLKDTTGANGTSGAIASQTSLTLNSATACVITNFFANQSTFTFQPQYAPTNLYKFPVPIQFKNGIVGFASAAPAAGTARWTILYRKLNSTER